MNARDQAFLKAHQASRWLATVSDLDDLPQVRIALRHGGYDEFEIDDMLDDAIRSEKDRRAIARVIRAPAEVACIAAFLFGIFALCIPDRAFAGEVQPMDPAWDWGAFAALVLGLFVFVLAIFPRRNKVNISEPYADENDYGRH